MPGGRHDNRPRKVGDAVQQVRRFEHTHSATMRLGEVHGQGPSQRQIRTGRGGGWYASVVAPLQNWATTFWRREAPARLIEGDRPPQIPRGDEDRNAWVATGKAIDFLMKMETEGSVGLESNSVYGSAVAIPQIARSAGWGGTLLALTVRSYLFLTLNILLQGFLLLMIGDQQHILLPFAGQMHLCDFGASMENCPNGPNCLGPGGTRFSYPRLYDFTTWSTRIFVRDSFRTLFPDRESEIRELVDPGEYGLENYYCRCVCCFLFSLAVMNDLKATVRLGQLLWYLPSSHDKWITYEKPDFDNLNHAKKMFGWSELDLVKFKVAGLPFVWKLINAIIVLLPKIFLWWILVSSGFRFLMETAGIVDLMMNSMALSFVLSLDELIFDVLTTVPVKHIMKNISDYELATTANEEAETEEQILRRFARNEFGMVNRVKSFMQNALPGRVLLVSAIMIIFLAKYYLICCDRTADDSWISKPMHLPKDGSFSIINFLFSRSQELQETPFWIMPNESENVL